MHNHTYGMASQARIPNVSSAVQVILWQSIVVVIDNGRARPGDYAVLRTLVADQAGRLPGGMGCLAVIPPNAVPPTDDARQALNAALHGAKGSLRCMCWLVEGAGFQGAMVQAVITGLRLFTRRAYATHVSTELPDAVLWLLSNLESPGRPTPDAALACQEIRRQRLDGPGLSR